MRANKGTFGHVCHQVMCICIAESFYAFHSHNLTLCLQLCIVNQLTVPMASRWLSEFKICMLTCFKMFMLCAIERLAQDTQHIILNACLGYSAYCKLEDFVMVITVVGCCIGFSFVDWIFRSRCLRSFVTKTVLYHSRML